MAIDNEFETVLSQAPMIRVHQRHEGWELLGFETRNKYEILDANNRIIGYAAEQQKGFLGLLLRQFLGHWRKFDIHIFDANRTQQMTARHPFRFIFQRLELFTSQGKLIGALQQRFSILSKKFDIEDENGMVLLTVNSPIWKIWTFPVYQSTTLVAQILKKWSGILSEGFTDKDNFWVEYSSPTLRLHEKKLLLAAAIFVDLQYFERRAN